MQQLILTLALALATTLASPTLGQDPFGASKAARAKAAATQVPSKFRNLVGRRVLVIEEGAEIRTREAGVVWKAYLGEVMTISRANGDWIWSFDRGGWMEGRLVTPFETAVFEMNQRLKTSRSTDNFALRGITYMAHHRYKDAITDFNEVIRRNQNDPGAYVNRGNAYRSLGNQKKAIADYSRALELDRDHFHALNNRGLAHTSLKRYDRALLDLQSAILLNPKFAEAFNNRGVVYLEQNQTDAAIKEFSTAIDLYPRYLMAYRNRAVALQKKREHKKVLADLSKCVTLAANDEEVLNDYAWFLATCEDDELRDGEKALEYARAAGKLSDFKTWNVLDTYAVAHAEAGQFAEALKWGRKALAAAPADSKAEVQQHLAAFRRRKPVRETSSTAASQ